MTDELRHDAPIADLEDEYEIIAELGRGGSAIVYHGRDRVLGREVAIKVVRPRFAAPGDDGIARLSREARTVAQLEHPNIVKIHAVKRLHDEGLALVMQFVPGRTLKQAIIEDGAFPVDRAERVIRDVAQALAYANKRGVVHRDVKPENIFIDAITGRAMLSDFGIAHSAEFDSRLTMTGTAIGTPAYMAPEQIDGAAANARSDVYSLGLVSWEMLTGRRPFEGESLYNVIFKQKNEDLPPIDEYNPAVPTRLQYIVERMLQKKPAARWAGADGLLAHLDASVLPEDWSRWQESHRKRKLRRASPRAKAAGFVSAAMATIRFQRPPAGVPEGVRPASDPAATPGAAVAEADAEDDAIPSWSRAAAHERPVSRLPVLAAVAFVVVAGGAAALYATRDGEADAITLSLPTYSDVGTVELAIGARADSQALADSLARLAAADSAANPTLVLHGDSARAGSDRDAVVYATPLRRDMPPAEAPVVPPAPPMPTRTAAVPAAAESTTPTVPSASAGGGGAMVRATDDRGIVAAGGRHTCVLSGTRLFCWGANDEGQLGDGEQEARTTPAGIVGDIDFVQVSAGIAHSCGVTRGGDGYCWGADERGQLGDATTTSRSAPVRVAGNLSFRSIQTGRSHSCGLTTSGEVACWGNNANGQLGDGTTANRSTPVRVASSMRFVSVTAGWNHSCGITTTGVAFCWGDNAAGQLGDGSRSERRAPEPVRTDVRFTSIAAGSAHSCAISVAGEAWCWGRNSFGQVGDGSTTDRNTPSRVDSPLRFASVSAGSVHNCARTQAGLAHCWGRNSYGQLGDGTTSDRARPVAVAGGIAFAAVSATGAHSCGVSVNGETSCWGYNVDGQLGDGTRTHRSRPTRVVTASR